MENKTKLDPIFVLGITLFFIAGCAYAYSSYTAKQTSSSLAVNEQSSVPSYTTSTNSEFSATSIQRSITATKTVPIAVKNNSASSSAAIISSTDVCDASNLDGSASLETRQDGSLFGTLKINNRGKTSCELSPSFNVAIFSGTSELSISQITANSRKSALLSSNETETIHFVWSNWCSNSSNMPLQIKFSLANNKGYLQLPIISTAGAPQSTVPSCSASANSSTLVVQ